MPNRGDHSHARIAFAVLKEKGEVARLDDDLVSGHENRLEANAFLANVSLGAAFAASADLADGGKILVREAILVAVDNDVVVVNMEGNLGRFTGSSGSGVMVVVRILQEFENEPCTARVKIAGKTVQRQT